MWLLWEECLEKLLRLGRRVSQEFPKALAAGQSGSSLALPAFDELEDFFLLAKYILSTDT